MLQTCLLILQGLYARQKMMDNVVDFIEMENVYWNVDFIEMNSHEGTSSHRN